MARGLSPNELRALRAEYGSDEAIVAAHPDLADQFAGMREASEQARRTLEAATQAWQSARPVLSLAEPERIDPAVLVDRPELALQQEMLKELIALRRASEAPPSGQDDLEIDPRSNPDEYKAAIFWRAVALLEEGAELTAIEKATGLSANKVRKIRDWKAHPSRHGPHGSPGYHLDPGESPGTLRLLKLRKPR